MKLVAVVIVILVVVAVVVGPQALFVLDENSVAIVTRFGEVLRSESTPGLKAKAPFVDSVTYFEKRLLLFDAPPSSLLTKDKKRLIIDVYARGKIIDPRLFREKVRTETQAISRGVDIIASELRREIASDNQAEIITTQREPIMARVLNNVRPKLLEFGIEIIDVRIKRADFPAEIAQSVYARMQAERKRKADRERAEGAEVDAEIRADVDRQATIIRALAERDANITRGCGEAQSIKIFAAALERDPEFYTFQRSLEAYGAFLTQNSTVILPVGGIGQLFEDIRQGLIEGSRLPDEVSDGAEPAPELELVSPGSRCAEVAAHRFLSEALNSDLTEIDLIEVAPEEWSDSSLGCPEEDRFYRDIAVPGFSLKFQYEAEAYELHTDQHGSQVVFCES